MPSEQHPFNPDSSEGGIGLPVEDETDQPDSDETGRDIPLEAVPVLDRIDFLPLRKDLKQVAGGLTIAEVRFIVDNYYTWQANRIASHNQATALSKTGEPHMALEYIEKAFKKFEDDMQAMLDAFTRSTEMGQWSRSILGVGPVLAAGLQAHLDITKAPTVGHFWRFAGVDPTIKWLGTKGAADLVDRGVREVGQEGVSADLLAWLAAETHRRHEVVERFAVDPETGKYSLTKLKKGLARRPWNAALKVMVWKLGESFNKVQNYERDYYGKKIAQRKRWEWEKNLRGDYADQAVQKLVDYRIGTDTDAYFYYGARLTAEMAADIAKLPPTQRQARMRAIAGAPGSGVPMLPPGHIFARSKRWGAKLYLAHWHGKAYRLHFKTEPPKPYAIEFMGHVHYMPEPVVD